MEALLILLEYLIGKRCISYRAMKVLEIYGLIDYNIRVIKNDDEDHSR